MASLTRTRKKIKKPRSRKGGQDVSVLMSLPNDLLLEVIAKVASNSFDDLCRIRQSCKEFNKAGQHDYIFEHVSIDKFPFIPLRRKEEFSEFLGRCGKCGNAEALYRQGVVRLFNLKEFDFESGFECLKKAAAKGHKEAMYVYGVFLVCVGGEAKQQGVQCLSSLNREDLSESRERTMTCIRSMWANNVIIGAMLAYSARVKTCSQCGNVQDNFVSKRGWDDLYDESDNLSGCDSCKMNREVNIFCDRLRGCTKVNLV
ncbi:putative F-box protein At1g67623 [Argentina anserina]|uniref:putative F-box protein At1g67623 n=1 Tax=Argentina anserina TaxID=57926 RepID=UPI00217622E4|nr:putative F-box protein At1g67623 [Potentilla anserina]